MRLTNKAFQEIMKNGHCKIKEENGNKTSLPSSHVEPDFSYGFTRQNAFKAFDSQVSIRVHSKRHRLTDPDGAAAKWVIDSLVEVGLFPDDSPKEIQSVSYSQEKIPSTQEEQTIVTIEEL